MGTDFTYVPTWAGIVHVAFVLDVFSRRIVGWKADTSRDTSLVPDALEMALWTRDHTGHPVGSGLVQHSDAGSRYTSIAFTNRLVQQGIDASIGTVGDAYDSALMESATGLYKTELIKPGGPWRTLGDVEFTTLEYVDWYSNQRLHGEIGHLPSAKPSASVNTAWSRQWHSTNRSRGNWAVQAHLGWASAREFVEFAQDVAGW
ncbi:putative transposase [Saccharopolyspora shandongensis]|uniref:Putative transposase n=1 Tax=Saccharopolyspora shandongensis TaxID=418495 RepID=A0A1H3KHX5_9PSEU|nr:DDE-type integrase/transposase/recombinase [Saccharopolyspora shandongensis]SDY51747.1 putative transposase [Saccharopolyspora shandongensis]